MLKVSVIDKSTNYKLQDIRYISKVKTQLLSEIILIEIRHTVIKPGYTLTVQLYYKIKRQKLRKVYSVYVSLVLL